MVLQFGKFIGKDLEEVPSDYLKWIINNVTTDEELIEEAEKEYEFREKWRTHFYGDSK